MPVTQPHSTRIEADVVPQTTAGTAQETIIGEAPYAGTVTEINIIPQASVTANSSNYRTFTVLNRGQSGVGTTSVTAASSVTVNSTGTTGWTGADELTMALHGTAANLVLAAGDVLEVVEAVVGTGVAHGGYEIVVTVTRS